MGNVNRSELKALKFLAEYPQRTPYRLEKTTGMAHSTVHRLFQNLIKDDLVAVLKEKWYAKGDRRELSLSLKGIIYVISNLWKVSEKDFKKEKELFNKIIQNYRDSHVLFRCWTDLERAVKFKPNIGTSLMAIVFIASKRVYNESPWLHLPQDFDFFRKSYPMAALGIDDLLTLYFFGFLAAMYENDDFDIVESVPNLYVDLKESLDKMSNTIVSVESFVEKFK